MKSYGSTHKGKQKPVNEDSFITKSLSDSSELIVVADGMGGHNAGDVASKEATDAFVSSLELENQADICAQLKLGIKAAAQQLVELADENEGMDDMGTTLVAGVVDPDHVRVVNIGDSRGYLISDDGLEQITEDHSFVQELVDAGEITEEEAKTHPNRNVVTRAIGTDGDIEVDTFERETEQGVLLCSDGLTEEVPEEAIAEVVCNTEPMEDNVERLIQMANENGGSDNISVVIAG
jgi:Serine/threonine protein phosphatase